MCCAWRRTPTGSSPRWMSGSARTPRDLSPDRSATPSPAPSGWPWSGHRSVISVAEHEMIMNPLLNEKVNTGRLIEVM